MVEWIDVSDISFNSILLLEAAQLGWLQKSIPTLTLSIALHAHPPVEWYLRHKRPDLNEWIDRVMSQSGMLDPRPEVIRQAEEAVLRKINDWLTYALDPGAYDAQSFLC